MTHHYTIIISDNLGKKWFSLPPVITSQGVESWADFWEWCEGREVDVFIKFMYANRIPF